jgi:hypothetical protein
MILGVITWVILYTVYVFIFPPFVAVQNTVVGLYGVQFPTLQTMATNLTSDANAAFIIIAIGVAGLMVFVGYLAEPLSSEVGPM